MKYKWLLGLIALALVIGVSVSAWNRYEELVMSGKTFYIDIAQSDYLLHKGLSGKKSISPDYGMLFIFPKEDTYGIWMKDMNFPIDILWIDKDSRIIHIEKNVLPDTYPKIFTPPTPNLYVLEISAGQVDALGTKIGDFVTFEK